MADSLGRLDDVWETRWTERERHDVIVEALTTVGLRASRRRDAIIRVFLGTRGHETIEEISAYLETLGLRLSPIVVGHVLEQLAREDGATEATARPVRGAAWAGARSRQGLVCTACGSVEAFEDVDLAAEQAAVARQHGFTLEAAVLDLQGTCSACRGARRGGMN